MFRCVAPITLRSQGNRSGARDCMGRRYNIVISGFDAVRFWYGCECSRGDPLELLLKCSREDIVNLETVIEMTHPEVR